MPFLLRPPAPALSHCETGQILSPVSLRLSNFFKDCRHVGTFSSSSAAVVPDQVLCLASSPSQQTGGIFLANCVPLGLQLLSSVLHEIYFPVGDSVIAHLVYSLIFTSSSQQLVSHLFLQCFSCLIPRILTLSTSP